LGSVEFFGLGFFFFIMVVLLVFPEVLPLHLLVTVFQAVGGSGFADRIGLSQDVVAHLGEAGNDLVVL
jgi:hypothetical protein